MGIESFNEFPIELVEDSCDCGRLLRELKALRDDLGSEMLVD